MDIRSNGCTLDVDMNMSAVCIKVWAGGLDGGVAGSVSFAQVAAGGISALTTAVSWGRP